MTKSAFESASNQSLDINESSIHVRNIDFSFGSGKTHKQVLFDCNLDLSPGEIVILTGPSGSGKTTLLTLIGSLRSIQKGSIFFLGADLRKMSVSKLNLIRRGIGFIFQGHNLFDALTAAQTIRLAMALQSGRHKQKKWFDFFTFFLKPFKRIGDNRLKQQQCSSILERLGLADLEDSLPSEMSTGQKQRVAIARALINHPRIILADEPTASLDKDSGLIVMDLLRERAKEDKAIVLIVSHDHRLFPLVDRVVHMEDGTIIDSSS